jgi:hypothetical protein
LRNGHPGAVEHLVEHSLDGGVSEEYGEQRLVVGAIEPGLQEPTT